MAVGHVRAQHQEQVRGVQVVVAAGRTVGPERLLVAGAGAGHAQPRVGLHPLGPQVALGELVGQILRLDGHLPRHVQRDRVGPVLVADRRQPGGHRLDGGVHAGRRGLGAALRTDQSRRQAAAGAQHIRGRGALGAESTPVSGVIRSAGGLRHHAVGHMQVHTAAHAAVTAHRGDRFHAPSRPRRSVPWWRGLVSAPVTAVTPESTRPISAPRAAVRS